MSVRPLHTLEGFPSLSPGERTTLARCWERLDQVTDPNRPAARGATSLLAGLLADAISGPPR